ncbi:MAG: low molecular weight protein arginine phosphatase [Kiritimatiellia bacterium]|nr:low molecular weight protein arginine phosphatase [Lentisphaerota bacterium]
MSSQHPRRLIFICTGNLCRSPMAEYLMRHHLRGVRGWSIASAGLFAAAGLPASAPAVEVLSEKGIDLTPHRSRLLTKDMVDSAALLVVMTRFHATELKARYPAAAGKVRMLSDFGDGATRDIPDPIGGSVEVYRTIRDEINSALLDLVLFLKGGEFK